MQVKIIEVNKNWEALLNGDSGFIEYFYNSSHNEHIETFFVDVCWLMSPQRIINNIDVKKELRNSSIRFFRRSLENLLACWQSYSIDKAKR